MNALLLSIVLLSCGLMNTSNNTDSLKTISNFEGRLQTGWYYISDSNNTYKRQLDKTEEYYFINPMPILTAKNIRRLQIYADDADGFILMMRFDDVGTEAWTIATEKAIGKKLAFIVDDKLVQAPFVNSQITAGVTALNRVDYSRTELEQFKKIIESEK
jgi:preprotein translocase subunit SecD